MSMENILTLIAILIGPILAVVVGQFLQNRKVRIDRREKIYKDLMGTRRLALHIDHVKALNMIDVEFSLNNNKDAAVRDAWQLYIRHLEDHNFKERDNSGWSRKVDELLCNLLERMSKALGCHVQRSQIEKGSYSPVFYINTDYEQQILRRCIIDLANGKKTLKVFSTDVDPQMHDA